MVEICTWDEAFTTKYRKEDRNIIMLYWYLFNKPDYQSNIANTIGNLRDKEEFGGNIPSSLTYENNIANYFRKMEEYNLIGIKETRKNIRTYQALSLFYLDPFCIRTPESKKKDIESHYQEYSGYLKEISIDRFNMIERRVMNFILEDLWSSLAFKFNRKNNSVIPAQRIVQYYSSDPERFMKKVSQRKVDYIKLYELIRRSFREVCGLCDFRANWMNHEMDYQNLMADGYIEDAEYIKSEFLVDSFPSPRDILDWRKVNQIIDDNTMKLIRKFDIVDWFGSPFFELLAMDEKIPEAEEVIFWNHAKVTEKDCWDIIKSHALDAKSCVSAQLSLYRDFERGNFFLDKNNLRFKIY